MKTSFIRSLVLLLPLLIGAPATVVSSSACCPDGFVTLEGRCLFVDTAVFDGKARSRNWTVSRDLCTALSTDTDTWVADLASVDIDLLTTFTTYLADNIPGMNYFIFWVGAQKIDGVWQWLDGSPIDNMSFIWFISSPSIGDETKRGMIVPSGGYNRFYLNGYSDSYLGPSFLCEAKRRHS